MSKTNTTELMEFTPQQLELIKTQIARDCTDAELELFVTISQRTGLDPFSRQIYAVKRKGANGQMQMTIQTGIDGFRLIADRSKRYAGSDAAIFTHDNEGLITCASVTVWKLVQGQRCSFTAVAYWSEYCQYKSSGETTHMWQTKPYIMLAKCAEAQALRKGFPAELSGLYTSEEMMQAENPVPTPAVTRIAPLAAAVASNKINKGQTTALTKALTKMNFTAEEMNTWKLNIQTTFHVESLKDLTEKDAEVVIDYLELQHNNTRS